MSIAELSRDNDYTLFIEKLHCTDIDNLRTAAYPFDFNTDLRIGQQLTGSIFIGKPAIGPDPQTPVYIDGELYNSAVASGYSAVAPVVAVDANGIIVDNILGEIKMEIADATHSGIVTSVAQTFAGDKTFNNNLLVPSAYSYAGAVGKRVCTIDSDGRLGINTLLNLNIPLFSTALGIGCLNSATGIQNTAVGYVAGALMSSGSQNCLYGSDCGAFLSTGSFNSYYGNAAGHNSTSANNNVMIGDDAGNHLDTGDSNVLIGVNAGNLYFGGESNNILIGRNVQGTGGDNNTIRIGLAGSHTANFQAGIFGAVGNGTGVNCFIDNTGKLCTVPSLREYKENIVDLPEISSILNQLQPRQFTFVGSNIVQYGMIYDEVEGVCDTLLSKNIDDSPQGLKYNLLSTMLLKGFKEQQLLIDSLDVSLATAMTNISNLQTAVADLQAYVIAHP